MSISWPILYNTVPPITCLGMESYSNVTPPVPQIPWPYSAFYLGKFMRYTYENQTNYPYCTHLKIISISTHFVQNNYPAYTR